MSERLSLETLPFPYLRRDGLKTAKAVPITKTAKQSRRKIMIERTSAGLANTMFEELEALKSGASTPQQASAKARVANTIISVSRLEMDYARFVAAERSDDKSLPSLPIGVESAPA